jgi:hypothetical protein
MLPIYENHHLREYGRPGRTNGGAPRELELGRLQSHDNDNHANDDRENDQDFHEHGDSPPLWREVMRSFRDLMDEPSS